MHTYWMQKGRLFIYDLFKNRRNILPAIEQYKPFIIKTAKEFNIKGYDPYDMVQIGYVTLIN